MDDSRFDDFTRTIVTSRRRALKILLGGAASAIAAVRSPKLAGAAPGCKALGRKCAADADCCSGLCDPASGRCVCGPGTEECRHDCIPLDQYQTDVENCGGCRIRCRNHPHGTATCTDGVCGFVCDAGYRLCGERCCADDRDCCNGDCCGPNQCCTPDGCAPCNCRIDGEFFDQDQINPANACQYCDPTRDRHNWTLLENDTFCGTGRVCCNGECCSPSECCDGVQCTDVNCPDQCEIQGQPVEAGERNPANNCQECRPETNRFDWTTLDDQTACGGVPGRVCCNGECCSPTECCGTTSCEECGPHCRIDGNDIDEGTPNPDDPCQVCKPEVSFTTWSTADDDTECGIGRVCCSGTCCPDNQCCNAGTCGDCRCEIEGDQFDRGEVNPFNKCEVCDPDRSRDSWSPGPPNTPCGLFDERFCCSGQCCSGDACCNAFGDCETCGCVIDGEPVLDDTVNSANTCLVCDAGKDRHAWTVLGDGEACGTDADDRVCCAGSCCPQGQCCQDGSCQDCGCEIAGTTIESGTVNSDNTCEVCDPSRARFDWSPVLGEKACGADGTGSCCGRDCCTAEQCCLIDACGECLCEIEDQIFPPDTPNPDNVCQACDPHVDPFNWTDLADKEPCAGLPDQVCCGGSCCDPGLCCVDGACQTCGCTIGGQDFADGDVNPDNECEVCDPSVSTTDWSPPAKPTRCQQGEGLCCGRECCFAQCCPGGVCCAGSATCGECGGQECTIEGQTVSEGTINPDSPCEACNPFITNSDWTVRPDDDFCGAGGKQFCCNGVCCPQGECCNADNVCEAGGGFACQDSCEIGGEFFPRGFANPANPCQECNPTNSATDWSPRLNIFPCGDELLQACCNGVCCALGACCSSPFTGGTCVACP